MRHTRQLVVVGPVVVVALLLATPAGAQSPQATDVPLVTGFVSLGVGATWPSDLTLVGQAASGIDMARFISTYPQGTTRLVDINGGVVIDKHWIVGMGMSRSSTRRAGSLTVELTHPEFHPTLTASSDTAPLEFKQITWHWDAGYRLNLGSRFKVMLVGGPARIQVARRLIDDLGFEEDIDFRTGQFYILGPGYAADTVQETAAWGYHVATDLTYQVSPRLGVGAVARYTRATLDYDNPIQALIDDHPMTARAVTSGFELSGGLRLELAPSSAGSNRGTPLWEIEVHAGAGWGSAQKGEVNVPMVGGSFTTFDGRPSRTVPSWYLKEGADLFNENAASRGAAGRIAPIDSVLDSSSIRLPRHAPFGMRLTRKLDDRYAVEFTVDVSNGGLELTEENRNRIEEARAGFERGFTTLLLDDRDDATGRALTNPRVSSHADITQATGRQVLTVGALRIDLLRGHRTTPYVTVGGGVLSRRGELPMVSLRGSYEFTSASNTPYDQIDFVNVRFTDNTQSQITSAGDNEECPWEGCEASIWSHSAVAVLGGGLTHDLSSRMGLRVDARAYLQRDPVRVLVDTLQLTFGRSRRDTIRFEGTPAIQISTAGRTSTLSVPLSDDEIEVARGMGVRAIFSVTAGVFWRF